MENASAAGPRAVHRRGLRPGRFPLEVLVDTPDPANDRRLKTGPVADEAVHVLLDQLESRTSDVKASAGRDELQPHPGSSQKASRQNGSRGGDRLTWPEFAPDPPSSILRPGCGVRYDLDSAPGRLYTGQFGHTRRSFATKASLVDDVRFVFGVRVWC